MPAYLLYLQADARRWRDSREEQLTAIDEVEQALELSNDFIAAWILDSDLRMSAQFYDSDHRADHQATGERAARRAIELDPELGAAHAALAEVLVSKGDWLGAEAEFREARRLNPALDAADMHSYCVLLLAVAYFAPAREHLEQQRRLEPEHSAVLRMLVLADAYLGEWQLAKTQYESGARLFKPWREYEMMHLMVGHDELAGAREIPAAGPINPAVLANLDDRQAALNELRRLSADPVGSALPTSRRDIAIWAGHFGDPDLALDMMRSAMLDSPGQAVYLWLPQLKRMRQLPAFKTFMGEIGIVAYWEKYGWPPICRKLRGDDFECD
jgi:tetratricopeptide (TPR) repeat protein